MAISARINESTIAYVGYARGPTQNLVKGGVGFSFSRGQPSPVVDILAPGLLQGVETYV